MDISNIKSKLTQDMDSFVKELELTKNLITDAQKTIMGTMREKWSKSLLFYRAMDANPDSPVRSDGSPSRKTLRGKSPASRITQNPSQVEIQTFLDQHRTVSIDEMLQALQLSEEQFFQMYISSQSLNQELDELDFENRSYEMELSTETAKLVSMEGRASSTIIENIASLSTAVPYFNYTISFTFLPITALCFPFSNQ